MQGIGNIQGDGHKREIGTGLRWSGQTGQWNIETMGQYTCECGGFEKEAFLPTALGNITNDSFQG